MVSCAVERIGVKRLASRVCSRRRDIDDGTLCELDCAHGLDLCEVVLVKRDMVAQLLDVGTHDLVRHRHGRQAENCDSNYAKESRSSKSDPGPDVGLWCHISGNVVSPPLNARSPGAVSRSG